ncbi:MAG: hypothetical protein ICV83_14250 [Cytophagales bacterium]|nr:hypothetical protein [Cytophagales bacterium]
MNLLRAHLPTLPAWLRAVRTSTPLPLAILLVSLLAACGGSAGGGTSAGGAKRLRLEVGKIKEVDFRLGPDTTLHLYSSSDNKEIVDVSRAESSPDDVAVRPAKGTDRAVFYIKGVSPGRASVVFSEKKSDQEGPGRTLSTYMVEVVSK